MKKGVVAVLFLVLLATVHASDITPQTLSFVLFKIGNQYFHENNFAIAEKLYLKSIELNKEFSSTYYNLGVITYERKEFADAEQWFSEAIARDRQNAKAEYSIGLLFFEQKEYTQAIEHLQRTIELQPDNENAYFDLGVTLVALYRSGNNDEALLHKALDNFEAASGKVQHAEENAEIIRRLIE